MPVVRLDPSDRAAISNLSKKLCKNGKDIESLVDLIANVFESSVNTPGRLVVGPGNTGSIASGFYSYTVKNIGNKDATLAGQVFEAGAIESWTAQGENDVLAGMSYDTGLTTLVIITALP